MKKARRLFCLLLAGLLLYSFLPVTVSAQDETGITETEAAAQTEDSENADAQGETEITAEPTDPADSETITNEDDADMDGTEETAGDAAEQGGLFGAIFAMSAIDDVVNNMDELEAWMAENPKGGSLTLGADIEITESVRLYLCRVEAESEIMLPDWVTLDTCIVSPFVTGGTVISRKISAVKPSFPYLFFIGEADTGFFDNQSMRCIITLTASGVGDEYEPVYIQFDDSGVDYDKAGEYPLPGVLLPPYDDLYAFDIVAQNYPLAAALTVYDPYIPYFYAFGNYFGLFSISYYYSGEYEDLTLWRSDDDGDSWRVYWTYDAPYNEKFIVEYGYDSFYLIFPDPEELSEPALFVFEVGEGEGSDILYVDAGVVKNLGYGGDRDSGDRILLPWELFFSNPINDDNGEENGNAGDNTNPPPNTGDENLAPEDKIDSQGSGGSNGSNSSGGNDNSNGNHNGVASLKPDTGEKQPDGDNSGGGDNGNEGDNTPGTQPATEVTDATVPAGIMTLDTPSDSIASNTAAVLLEPDSDDPDEPKPSPASIGSYANRSNIQDAWASSSKYEPSFGSYLEQPVPASGNPAGAVPEPAPEQAPVSSPFFPMLAASLTGVGGAGGLAYVFRKRRVKRVI